MFVVMHHAHMSTTKDRVSYVMTEARNTDWKLVRELNLPNTNYKLSREFEVDQIKKNPGKIKLEKDWSFTVKLEADYAVLNIDHPSGPVIPVYVSLSQNLPILKE